MRKLFPEMEVLAVLEWWLGVLMVIGILTVPDGERLTKQSRSGKINIYLLRTDVLNLPNTMQ